MKLQFICVEKLGFRNVIQLLMSWIPDINGVNMIWLLQFMMSGDHEFNVVEMFLWVGDRTRIWYLKVSWKTLLSVSNLQRYDIYSKPILYFTFFIVVLCITFKFVIKHYILASLFFRVFYWFNFLKLTNKQLNIIISMYRFFK